MNNYHDKVYNNPSLICSKSKYTVFIPIFISIYSPNNSYRYAQAREKNKSHFNAFATTHNPKTQIEIG